MVGQMVEFRPDRCVRIVVVLRERGEEDADVIDCADDSHDDGERDGVMRNLPPPAQEAASNPRALAQSEQIGSNI